MFNQLRNALFLSALLAYSLASHAQISNMIVFGDSLSDGGNFPESPRAFWNPKAPESVLNSVPQFYVPFSNPVNTHGINPFDIPWPTLDDHYLSDQTPIENHPGKRLYRSISWPQFFLSIAKSKKHIGSDIISPNYLLSIRNLPNTNSYNYAWGYAPSSNHCVNPHYEPNNQCNSQTILAARNNYEKNQTEENYNHLQIPGLIQQMKTFIEDHKAQKIQVDKNTLYTFWTGANDLIITDKAWKEHYNPLPMFSFALGKVSGNVLKSVEMLIRALPTNERPKTVYVFTLFNPQLTPVYYYLKIAKLGNFLVKCSNFWLEWDVKLFNVFSSTKIVVVPAYEWYAYQSHTNYFKQHMSETCQIIVGQYQKPDYAPPSNCEGFMFWNAVHPASPMNAIIARDFSTQIMRF